MRTFIVCLLVLTFATTVYTKSTGNSYVDMGLMYAQSTLGFNEKCFSDLTQAWQIGLQIYEAIMTPGSNTNIIGIIMQAIPLIQ